MVSAHDINAPCHNPATFDASQDLQIYSTGSDDNTVRANFTIRPLAGTTKMVLHALMDDHPGTYYDVAEIPAGSGNYTIVDSSGNPMWVNSPFTILVQPTYPAALVDGGAPPVSCVAASITPNMDIKTDTDQTFSFSVTDTYGYTATGTFHARLDLTPPAFQAGAIGVILGGGDATHAYQRMTISWPGAPDPVVNGASSGFKSYQVMINGSAAYVAPITDVNTTSCTIALSDFDRASLDNHVEISVIAADVAGNTSTLNYPAPDGTFLLPKQVSIGANRSAVLDSATVSLDPFSNIKVTLPLNITPQEFNANYSQLTLVRTGGSNLGTNLNQTIAVNPQQTVVGGPSSPWQIDPVTGNVDYIDTIAPLMGIGGKQVAYSIASETVSGQQDTEIGGGGQTPTLPAHPGVMSIQIQDMKGNGITISSDGTTTGSAKALVLDAAGRVQVSFQGTGIDQDGWTAGIHELIPQKIDAAHTITQDYELGGSGNSNMSCPYDGSYNLTTHQYAVRTVPITLSLGDNNIRLQWVQQGDPSQATQYSGFVDLDFEMLTDGIFTLNVTTPASPTVKRTGSGALLVSPGQLVNFSLTGSEGEDLSGVNWDFGDEAVHSASSSSPASRVSGASASHVYDQAPGQIGATASYSIIISNLPNYASPAALPVVVQDTQDGGLYESEVWNGPHTVSGNVIVPPGMTLTVGSMAAVNTSVVFSGGLEAALTQGITVQGGLFIGTTQGTSPAADGAAVSIAPDPGSPSLTGQSWGTILVTGRAAVDNAVISGGERGLTAGSGSTVALLNSQFSADSIGLHVLSPSAMVSGCSFISDSAYGVKEEAGGRPVMAGNQFGGNGVDYYQDGVTGISMDALNKLTAGNSGNTSQ